MWLVAVAALIVGLIGGWSIGYIHGYGVGAQDAFDGRIRRG
jgi:hypothetical protein